MRNYPFMNRFLRSLKLEDDPEALEAIGSSITELDRTYANIYDQIDSRSLVQPGQLSKIIDIIDWVSNGFLEQYFKVDDPDPDALYESFSDYLTLLRTHFYASEVDGKVSFAKEELIERNETVMKEMRLDMTLEERLIAGRKPLVETEENEEEEGSDDTGHKAEEAGDAGADEGSSKDGETIDDIIKEAEKNISASDN